MSDTAFNAPHFIVNARLANRGYMQRLEAVREQALRRFPQVRWTLTKVAGDAVSMARAAAQDGADLVVAVGGDGTINEVVNGLMTAGTEPPALGTMPFGSGCDFARSIAVPQNLGRALHVLVQGHCHQVDVGEITCAPLDRGSPEPEIRRYFMNIAGCGASGRVVERFNRRHFPGTLGYVVASALTAIDYKWPEVTITIDDQPPDHSHLNVLFVCNGEYCGGGMHVGNGARLDDGLMQVVEVGNVGRIGAMFQWPRLYLGRLDQVRGARVRSARVLRVTSNEDVLVDCDGDLCGRLPATYRIVPLALRVVTGT